MTPEQERLDTINTLRDVAERLANESAYTVNVTLTWPDASMRLAAPAIEHVDCGAQEWAYNDDGSVDVIGTCQKSQGHESRWHREDRDGALWAEWSGPADERAPAADGEMPPA